MDEQKRDSGLFGFKDPQTIKEQVDEFENGSWTVDSTIVAHRRDRLQSLTTSSYPHVRRSNLVVSSFF